MPEARSLSLRIQGLDLAAPRDWPRLSQRHVATGLEPLRAWLGSDVQAARIGARRVEEQLGWRQLSARNQRLVLGSGAAQAAWADPRRTLFAACGDAPRGMSLDPGTALQAMTRTPGLISGQGARRGSLEVGRSLDLTVFQQDPLRTPSERLLKLEVLYTVINGELVHSLR
jgi:predicted amidohydrolase YtcJ